MERIMKSIEEPVVEPVVKPIVEPVVEPNVEPIVEPNVESVVEPVDKTLLVRELEHQTCLSGLSRGNMQLYLIEGHKAPSLMREIGRQREIAFRTAGGGTGLSCDVDRFDLDPELGFRQLICWDSQNREVMGGYRILFGRDCRLDANGQPDMPSAHLFRFSDHFIRQHLPNMMEMSRSFTATHNIFTLNLLFSGLAVLCKQNRISSLFGKVTFFPSYPSEALGLLEAFAAKHCPDPDSWIVPHTPYLVPIPDYAASVLVNDSYEADLKALTKTLHEKGFFMPPILKSYLRIFSGFRVFGTAVNDIFGNVIEMGMFCYLNDITANRFTSLLK